MYAPLGLVGASGAIVSLISILIKTKKKQSRRASWIALAVCCVLIVVSLFINPSSDPAAVTAAVSATSAPTAASVSAPVGTVSPSSAPSEAPAAVSTPAPAPASAPTSVPTAESAPTLAPVSDEMLDEGYLDAWFDDSLMIGDSIAGGLNMYGTKERENGRPCLGSMRIVGVSGLTLQNALAGESKSTAGQVIFRARFMTISEVVELTQAKRLFLMMGVRDLEWYSPDRLIDIYDKIISLVKADHPDLRIYVHSIMPTLKLYAETANLDYNTRKVTNEKLRAFCEEKGYTYLELTELVLDEEGFLKFEYSGSDYSFHPNDTAKAIWVKLLRSCARDEYYAGLWNPEE